MENSSYSIEHSFLLCLVADGVARDGMCPNPNWTAKIVIGLLIFNFHPTNRP